MTAWSSAIARWCFRALVLTLAIVIALAAIRIGRGAVNPDDLAKLIDQADKLVVLEGPRDGAAALFESSDRIDLNALKTAVRVERPKQKMHCMCDGSPAIKLYANGEQIGLVTNHHAHLIRCNLWRSDAPLADAEALLAWFDNRNIPGPRQEYEASLKRQRKEQEQERKWIEAMPPALRPVWPNAARQYPDLDHVPFRQTLDREVPEKNKRILALFSWYGSGCGLWSGYPAYEDVAEKMLLDYPTADLVALVKSEELTAAQTEGVARFFGGWTFSQLRPKDRRLLPPDLKARLLKHSLASADEDKRHRAKRAFSEE